MFAERDDGLEQIKDWKSEEVAGLALSVREAQNAIPGGGGWETWSQRENRRVESRG